MPNTYFKFKQFIINQERCAMKVGTDGVLLGAWTNTLNATRILDIGTGTGLLALMMAQKSEARIDAVEIDQDAYVQAKENINLSKWKKRIHIYHTSLQDFYKNTTDMYDLILSNPPFFSDSLQPSGISRALARHSVSLTLQELIELSARLLSRDGRCSFILPSDKSTELKTLLINADFYLNRLTYVKPNHKKDHIRMLVEISRCKNETVYETITLEEDKRHHFTKEYINLTKDFYLAF